VASLSDARVARGVVALLRVGLLRVLPLLRTPHSAAALVFGRCCATRAAARCRLPLQRSFGAGVLTGQR
jgi:hypothetical protein